MRRRTWIVVGTGLFAFAVLVRALLPLGARMAIERFAGDALGRRVEVADVDFGLLFGRAQVEGLAIGGPDRLAPIGADDAVVRCSRLGVQLAWLPLLRGRIHLREIALVEPSVRLERNPDGSLAPIVLAPPAPEPEAPPEPEPEDGGLDLAIDRFSLDRAGVALVRRSDQEGIAELRFENFTVGDLTLQQGVFGVGAVTLRGPDLTVHAKSLEAEAGTESAPAEEAAAAEAPAPAPAAAPPRHRVQDLDIESARFAWRTADGEVVDAELELHAQNLGIGAERFPFQLRLDTERAKLNLEGEVAFQPVSFEGELRWRDLLLPTLSRVAPDAGVAVKSGRSDGQLAISLRLEDAEGAPAGVKLSGRASVADLDLATADESVALRWQQLDAELASFAMALGETPGAPEIELAKLTLAQPDVSYRVKPAADAAPTETPAGAEPPPAEPSPPPRLLLRELQIRGGKLRFADTSVRPGVETGLSQLELRARDVRWPERDVARLDLTAKGARGSSLKIAGSVKGGAGNVDVDLKQLPLSPFDPYAGQATGLKIADGRLSLAAKLSLGAERMGAKSQVSLHQLKITERESGWFQKAFGVPLDVAIALLQDLEGNITLPVNVEQDARGTSVNVGAAVAAALRQALVGALAAPLKLLGSVAGAGGKGGEAELADALEPIPMPAGRAELLADAEARIASLAQLLASRPGLGVLLIGRAGSEDDPELARRAVLARARAGQPLPGEDALGFFERRRVRRALAEADPDAQGALDEESATALTQLAAAVTVDDAAREALARERAEQVQRALVQQHGAPAEALRVETGSGAPGVAIELTTQ